jgi:hypothetical protein
MILNLFDLWPLWSIYIIIILLLFISAELGFYLGKYRKANLKDVGGEDKQTGSIMGASVGLLAFLLAFSFNIASNIHAERKALVIEEANSISTLYLRSQLFDLEQASELRDSIRDYVHLRIDAMHQSSNEELDKLIRESEIILNRFWQLVTEIVKNSESNTGIAQLINAGNKVIDLHTERVNAALKRLPIVSSFILIFIAILTLALMGYQSGLSGARVLIPRFALILSLSTVMIVIADLDRPGGELIGLSQHAMIELQKQISTDVE